MRRCASRYLAIGLLACSALTTTNPLIAQPARSISGPHRIDEFGGTQLGVVAISMPQNIQIGARERTTLTYLIRNQAFTQVTLNSSLLIYYLPDGTPIGIPVSQPLVRTIPARGSLIVTLETVISDAVVAACRNAGTDSLTLVRVFKGTDKNGNPLATRTQIQGVHTEIYLRFQFLQNWWSGGVIAFTRVKCLNSLTGRALIHELRVTAPTEDQVVARNSLISARALVRASGNGLVAGRWLVDGKPFEGFNTRVAAGMPVEVSTKRGIPTLEVGQHQVQLEILTPNNVRSREIRIIVSGITTSGRPNITAPGPEEVVSRTGSDAVLKWEPVAGASGYEVAFASRAEDLRPSSSNMLLKSGAPDRVLFRRRTLSASSTSLRLTASDLRQLDNGATTELYWTVVPLVPPDNNPLFDQAALPSSIRFAPKSTSIGLDSPINWASVAQACNSVLEANLDEYQPREIASNGREPKPGKLRIHLDTEFAGTDDRFRLEDLLITGVVNGGFNRNGWEGSIDSTIATAVQTGNFALRRALSSVHYQEDRFSAGVGGQGLQNSAFTDGGLGSNLFQATTSLGALRLGVTKTIDSGFERSNFGRNAGIQTISLETREFIDGRGLRLLRTESTDENIASGSTSVPFPSRIKARIWSLSGQYPLLRGLSLKAESAWSKNTVPTIDGSEPEVSGRAHQIGLEYANPDGWQANLGFRQLSSSFMSPGAQTIANNLRGWEAGVTANIGHYSSLGLQYTRFRNGSSSTIPLGLNESFRSQLAVQIPRFLPLQVSWERITGGSAPLVSGGQPAAMREQRLSIGTNGEIGRLTGYVEYSFSVFDDRSTLTDPELDIPNDSKTKSLTVGLGWRTGRLNLRGDWSDNAARRLTRDPFSLALYSGTDAQANLRLEAEYEITPRLSVSAVWSRARQQDVQGFAYGRQTDTALRFNWLTSRNPQSGYVVALEFRSSHATFGSANENNNGFFIVLNDSRHFRF